ncbi:type VI secretion system contractile sheath large subunit [Pseudomonadales bacterium]|nr:type VI secretion system contractile sheath large subunit [Pseudomonadales bacterium]MDA9366127.1 type VI secretion system contractile sheath large subunit [Pseudomonadales bacterium]MDB9867763.1 type VI secretion system contractile sheath large subunit [Pseudomonadales bacterium]MDB9879834.1 type VI secretion system contractile sheath large subunit [Pseudomonadales bacterium]MDB9917385.1 type VI secretion system contractile sheath large subunit [Pseudomonadales bacterium]|tara:strand:- start:3791 stop:5245 length:1455 start_codon:yes stop_codon:yes gene_type:complete
MVEATAQQDTLIASILSLSKFTDDEDSLAIATTGMQSLFERVFDQVDNFADIRVDKRFVEDLIDELDEKLSRQMDEILHNEEFKALEAPWRSLKFLTSRTNFAENIKISMLSVRQDELLDDFADAADITECGLYRKVYTDEYGQFGGEPFGVMIGNYALSPSAADVALMTHMSALSAMTHAPFIAGTHQSFFGINSYSEIPHLKQVEAMFEGPQYFKWRAFRDSDDSRNLGLTLPRFMLRATYGDNIPVKTFDYQEGASQEGDYLWGNAAFAYATRLTDSFARYRWCPNIIGPQSGGSVHDLPIDFVEEAGLSRVVGPIETAISDRKEYELSELGFIPLTLRKDADSAVFFSSNSTQKPKKFTNDDDGRQAEMNYKLGTQLPYLFIVNRLAHYIKVLQRENLGGWKSRGDLEMELNKWIRQYVADQDNPSAATRSQRPLRKASLEVVEVDNDAGWYQVTMEVTPHFKFMGANFTLSLTSMLERA